MDVQRPFAATELHLRNCTTATAINTGSQHHLTRTRGQCDHNLNDPKFSFFFVDLVFFDFFAFSVFCACALLFCRAFRLAFLREFAFCHTDSGCSLLPSSSRYVFSSPCAKQEEHLVFLLLHHTKKKEEEREKREERGGEGGGGRRREGGKKGGRENLEHVSEGPAPVGLAHVVDVARG